MSSALFRSHQLQESAACPSAAPAVELECRPPINHHHDHLPPIPFLVPSLVCLARVFPVPISSTRRTLPCPGCLPSSCRRGSATSSSDHRRSTWEVPPASQCVRADRITAACFPSPRRNLNLPFVLVTSSPTTPPRSHPQQKRNPAPARCLPFGTAYQS